MTNDKREKLIFDLINQGSWDKAIEHAKAMPNNWDVWQRMPSAVPLGMPDQAINKVLDHLGPEGLKHSGFLFEIASNLGIKHDTATIRRLANLSNDIDSYHETQKFIEHPDYAKSPEEEGLAYANNLWSDYELAVDPGHFAAVKSIYTSKPEIIKHRGLEGKSTDWNKAIPHLRDYAAKVQEKIINDDNVRKRNYNGEPYIKVHRGVGGHYSKMLRDAVKYNPKTGEYDSKNITVPAIAFSSWTTEPNIAKNFAEHRSADLLPGHGLIMSKWMPVKDILHSGYHRMLPEFPGNHPNEQELIFGHPTGRMKLNPNEFQFQYKNNNYDPKKEYGFTSKGYVPVEHEFNFDKGIKREKISKGIRDKALQLGIATAMLGMPQHMIDQGKDQFIEPQQQTEQKINPLPGLKYIEMVESSGNKNTRHQLVTSGVNAGTRAIGRYGIMPLQAIETVSKDQQLAQQYPEFLNYHHVRDQDAISQKILGSRDVENSIANSHWKRLYDRFDGDESRMAHAWNKGITGTLNTDLDRLIDDDYVKKYHRYKKMMNLERRPAELKKNESKLPPEITTIKQFTSFDSTIPDNQLKEKEINQLIENRAFHSVPGMGNFTHSSFVLGTNHDNAWLIKVEAGNRPGIISAKSGLQSVKESAFYIVARDIFGLGELLPEVLLGEVIYENDRKPAAAIKMLPSRYKLAVEQERERPGSMPAILSKYLKSGLLHRVAFMLYALGDGDSHGRNIMTDGHFVKFIDHGSGFANADFNPATDHNIFMPYILRAGVVKENMSPEEKLDKMPKIENMEVRKNLSAWILSINSRSLAQKLNSKEIDPLPTEGRLKKIQSMVAEGMEPDQAINQVWVRG